MSTVQFKCVSCGFEKAIPAQYAGKRVRCPRCQAENLVPNPPQQPTLSVAPAQRTPAPVTPPPAAPAPNVIKFHCPLCNQKIGVAIQHAGRQVRCPKCKAVVAVPAASGPAAPPMPVAPVPAPPVPDEHLQLEDFNLKPLDSLDEPGMSFERPGAPPLQHAQDEAAARAALMQATTSRQDRAAEPAAPGSRRRRIALSVIGGLYAIALLLLAGGAYTYFKGKPADDKSVVEPARAVASQFIGMLASGKTAEAKALASSELRKGLSDKQLAKLADYVKDSGGLVYKEQERCTIEKTGKLGVVLKYKPSSSEGGKAKAGAAGSAAEPNSEPNASEEQPSTQPGDQGQDAASSSKDKTEEGAADKETAADANAGESDDEEMDLGPSLSITLVEGEGGKFTIEGVHAVASDYKNSISAASSTGDAISLQVALSPLATWGVWLMKIAAWVVSAVLIVIGVLVACSWVIFDKAGEPGWAAIVPFYGPWVFAEVGGKPGWWGLVLAIGAVFTFCGCVRYFTVVADVLLFIVICVGVAKTFEKGPLYGLGLGLLAPIFFPILAFWDE